MATKINVEIKEEIESIFFEKLFGFKDSIYTPTVENLSTFPGFFEKPYIKPLPTIYIQFDQEIDPPVAVNFVKLVRYFKKQKKSLIAYLLKMHLISMD